MNAGLSKQAVIIEAAVSLLYSLFLTLACIRNLPGLLAICAISLWQLRLHHVPLNTPGKEARVGTSLTRPHNPAFDRGHRDEGQ